MELSLDVFGTIRVADLSDEKVDDATTVVAVDDEIEAKIINVDKKNRTIALSVKAKDAIDQAEVLKKYSRTNDVSVSTTIGDLLKEKMAHKESD